MTDDWPFAGSVRFRLPDGTEREMPLTREEAQRLGLYSIGGYSILGEEVRRESDDQVDSN